MAKQRVKVGINGFGRIGRLAMRAAQGHPDLEIVHINDCHMDATTAAYLLKYDSVQGTLPFDITAKGDVVEVQGSPVGFTRLPEPGQVPWSKAGVQIVMDCTGVFLTRAKLAPYFENGVKKVVVSAPVKEDVLNVVMGCNDELYDPAKDHIVTAASCTTNSLAPVIKVLLESVGIERGAITTIHNVTNTQPVVDAVVGKKPDLRRARSALLNLAPTTTGSATAITMIYPELKGKLHGHAIRVPLLNSSITDLVVEVKRQTTAEEVNGLLKAAAEEGPLKGILGYTEAPLVSTDYIGDKRSGIVDALSTIVVDGVLLKLYIWYDNEFGYSCRMVDLTAKVANAL